MEKEAAQYNSLSSQDVPLAVLPALCTPQGPRPTPFNESPRLTYKASKVMTHIGFACSMVATNAQPLRVLPVASLSIMVLNQLKFAPAISLLLRSELDATVGGLRVLNSY